MRIREKKGRDYFIIALFSFFILLSTNQVEAQKKPPQAPLLTEAHIPHLPTCDSNGKILFRFDDLDHTSFLIPATYLSPKYSGHALYSPADKIDLALETAGLSPGCLKAKKLFQLKSSAGGEREAFLKQKSLLFEAHIIHGKPGYLNPKLAYPDRWRTMYPHHLKDRGVFEVFEKRDSRAKDGFFTDLLIPKSKERGGETGILCIGSRANISECTVSTPLTDEIFLSYSVQPAALDNFYDYNHKLTSLVLGFRLQKEKKAVNSLPSWLVNLKEDIAILRQDPSDVGKAQLALDLHVFAKAEEAPKATRLEVKHLLQEIYDDLEPIKNHTLLPEYREVFYTGQDDEIVRFFSDLQDEDRYEVEPKRIPCEWLEDSPGLFQLTEPLGTGAMAHPATTVTCSEKISLPKSVSRLYLDLERSFGGIRDVIGTIRGVLGAWAGYIEKKILYMPQDYISEARTEGVKEFPFMAGWGLYSLWNFHLAQQFSVEFETAAEDLAKSYAAYPAMKGKKASVLRSAADRALYAYVRDYDRISPVTGDIRWAILHGVSATEIKTDYAACHQWRGPVSPSHWKYNDRLSGQVSDLVGPAEPPAFLSVNRPNVFKVLLDCGEDLHEKNRIGKTLLMDAAHFNGLDAAKILLQRFPAKERRGYVNLQTEAAETSEIYQDFNGNSSRPALNIKNGRRTALMYAAENASARFIRFLLNAGADTCMKDSQGLTAKDYFLGENPAKFQNVNIREKDKRAIEALLTCRTRPKFK